MTYYDNIQFYLKHTVQNEVVTKSNVEFIVTPEIANENSGMTAGTYALRGAGASYDPDDGIYNNDSPYYAKNKATLLRAFGNSNCIESSSDISCVAPGLLAYAYKNGYVMTGASELIACAINSDGSSSCDYYNGD